MVGGAERSLVIDESCSPLRRCVGPVAWSVLEELILVGHLCDGVLVADVSLRALAQRTGLSKDTVNRATVRLRAAGLVTCAAARHDDGGRFAGSSYRVDMTRVPIRRVDAPSIPPSAEPATPSRRDATVPQLGRHVAATQLELLPAD